tara:strand:- start:20108 stop:21421 length:1314 start_codon:yes stop_codon:yes gene_type:complete
MLRKNYLKEYIERQRNFPHLRWRLVHRSDKNAIYILDSFCVTAQKRISLHPYRKDVATHCELVWEKIKKTGDDEWEFDIQVKQIKKNSWDQHFDQIIEFLKAKNKGTTNKNHFSQLRSLRNNNVKFRWVNVKEWLYEKQPGNKSFIHRIDSLRQIQLYFLEQTGEYPAWLPPVEIQKHRAHHNYIVTSKKKGDQRTEGAKIRAIVEMTVAEEYFHANQEEYGWQCWALAMIMCYGLRPHELWFVCKDRKNWLYIPGRLTKSKEDHVVWPVFKHWIEEFNLFKNFDKYQSFLRKSKRPLIVDRENKSITTQVEDPHLLDMTRKWQTENNSDLGRFITQHSLGWYKKGIRKMPELRGYIPSKRGTKTSMQQAAVPYDLRHTWAVTMATLPNCDVSVEKCAKAMGHDVVTHTNIYQRWIDQRKLMDNEIDSIYIPDLKVA